MRMRDAKVKFCNEAMNRFLATFHEQLVQESKRRDVCRSRLDGYLIETLSILYSPPITLFIVHLAGEDYSKQNKLLQ